VPQKFSFYFNSSNASELAYIVFPEYNIRVLIDSGSKSFIGIELAFKFFPNSIVNDPFIVSTVFNQSQNNYSAIISAPKMFNLPEIFKLKFYLSKFHELFNGLIGLDTLKQLKANVDFESSFLTTPYTKIVTTSVNIVTTSVTC